MKELIAFIETNLHKVKLEQITSSVIDAYRQDDDFTLKTAASALQIPAEGVNRKKLFYSLIKKLHPDRLASLQTEFNTAVALSDINSLSGLKKLLDIRAHVKETRKQLFDFDYEETFSSKPDPSMGFSEDDEDDEGDFGNDGNSFINAVKREIFGNHNFSIDPSDLGQIDGVLNLQDYELDDIDGIEYCRNVSILNICDNDICNIYDLQFLTQLEELYAAGNRISDIEALGALSVLEIIDLSGNDVEDISPLLKMDNLKFADLRHNPAFDKNIIRRLEEQGVIVLW
ncbi:MAG: leucine-rich repeat domain-containing protein [Spirochaetales bacterium]|nr:leucine-rich repeat domain-containing protein [Spirochaetales bacterium]